MDLLRGAARRAPRSALRHRAGCNQGLGIPAGELDDDKLLAAPHDDDASGFSTVRDGGKTGNDDNVDDGNDNDHDLDDEAFTLERDHDDHDPTAELALDDVADRSMPASSGGLLVDGRLSSRSIEAHDRVLLVLVCSALPMPTNEVAEESFGRRYHPDVYRALTYLERLGFVDRHRLEGIRSHYWYATPAGVKFIRSSSESSSEAD